MISYFQPIGCISPELDGWQFLAMPGSEQGDVAIGSDLSGGLGENVWPLLDVPDAVHSGHRLPAFGNDWYERLHLSVLSINLGNVISNQEWELTLWNAYFAFRELISVESTGTGGITLVDLPTLPAPFPALGYEVITVLVDAEGPPVVDATFVFTFAGGETLTLTLEGRRVIVFPFPPNWASPVREALEWKTDVLRAHDGTEQRRSLRVTPRRSLDYNVLLKGPDSDLLETTLWGWSTRDFVLPIWTDMARSTTVTVVGAETVMVDVTDRSFVVGGYAVLFLNSTTYEACQIGALVEGGFTTVTPLQNEWPAGTKVYPAASAHISTTTATQRHTNRVLTGRMMFLMSPGENPHAPAVAAEVNYDGIEVVTTPLNWRQAISNDFTRQQMIADAGVGPISYFEQDAYTRITRPFEWVLRNKADIVAFRAFLARRQGQAKTCWIPSWHGDFTVVGTTGPSSASLVVTRTAFESLVGVDINRDRIRVRMTDGTTFYRKIEAVTVVDSNTMLLGLDDDFGIELNTSNVFAVDFLLRCRLASDRVEIPWITDGVANPTLVFTTVNA